MADQPTGTVTLLFSDIEGSTRLLEWLGRDRYAQALDLHRRLLREAFERHGGYEVDYEGDSFFVAFARAADAVAAAAAAQSALADAEWPAGGVVRVRMGVHTGEPLAVAPKYVGMDVHRAARIMAAGHGGQVLLSAATQRRAPKIETLSLGEHRLKDLLQPEPLYQLVIEGLPVEFPALKTLGTRPNNLPTQPNALIGRGREIDEVIALLRDADVRLVTLTGPGGTGKTRLALQVAAELLDGFESGVFFVSLVPIRDPELVIPGIAQALAVREAPGEKLGETLAAYLERKRMLLLLDNFEQVIEAAVQVGSILDRCSDVKILATSRERLRLRGERVCAVPPLPLVDPAADIDAVLANDAVALFAARADAATGGFTLDAHNAPVVAEICARLDALPLAIELAAARTVGLPPRALLRRIDQRLPLLTGGARDSDARQRTLSATIAWSYDLLAEPERKLFSRLAVFRDGCRLEAAEEVCDRGRDLGIDLIDGIESLVSKSLLRQREDADGEPRFLMFETLREFALERLGTQGTAVRSALTDHFVGVIAALAPGLRSAQLPHALARLSADEPNLRESFGLLLESKRAEDALRTACHLLLYWYMRGRPSEAVGELDAALSLPDPGSPARAEALNHLALAHAMMRADPTTVAAVADQAHLLAREIGDDGAIAFALNNLALARAESGEPEAARTLLEAALARAVQHGDAWITMLVLTNLGFVRLVLDDLDGARAAMVDVEQMYGAKGINPTMYAMSLGNLGEVALAEGDLEQAVARFAGAVRFANEIGMTEVVVSGLEGLVAALARRGSHAEAAKLAGGTEQLWSVSETTKLQTYEQQLAAESRAILESALGHERFEALSASGGAMTIDDAVSRALVFAAEGNGVDSGP